MTLLPFSILACLYIVYKFAWFHNDKAGLGKPQRLINLTAAEERLRDRHHDQIIDLSNKIEEAYKRKDKEQSKTRKEKIQIEIDRMEEKLDALLDSVAEL